jgi:AmmeMemoRadiSam system protein B
MIRSPAVAGRFYPADPAELAQQIDQFCALPEGSPAPSPTVAPQTPAAAKQRVIACVVPHAGYMYSGHVAGAVYSAIEIPSRLILLGPRHYPGGQPMSMISEGSFETPFGNARIDSALAVDLATACPLLRDDPVAHEREHSLEVQLPFLQRLAGDFTFVPVVLLTDRFSAMETLGDAVAMVVAAQSEPVLVVASTDMNHYEDDTLTREKDARAIERILALDPRGLYDVVRSEGISMCGYAATVAMLIAAVKLGARSAELIRYATSGDINGERDRVVGYAGIILR